MKLFWKNNWDLLLFPVLCLIVLFFVRTCCGQCPGGVCPVPPTQGNVIVKPPLDPNRLGAVIRVKTPVGRGPNGKESAHSGTASIVQWENKVVILTAWHIIKANPQGAMVLIGDRFHAAPVLYADRVFDFAVLGLPPTVSDRTIPPPLPLGAVREIRPGAQAYICGYGGNSFQKALVDVRFHGMMEPRPGQPKSWAGFRGEAIPGDSGSPVLTADGVVIGVVWGGSGDRNASVATVSDRIIDAINTIDRVAQSGQAFPDGEMELAPVSISTYEPRQYICSPYDPSCGRAPIVSRAPGTPGARYPVPEPDVYVPPATNVPAPIAPAPITPPSINVTCPAPPVDQAVTAAWVGDLANKIDTFDGRIAATEMAVGDAIQKANTVVTTVYGRLGVLEQQAMIDKEAAKELPTTIATIAGQVSGSHTAALGQQLRGEVATALQVERDQLPGKIATGADTVVKGYFPLFAACAVAIVLLILLLRRWLDKQDGVADGQINWATLTDAGKSREAEMAQLRADIAAMKAAQQPAA